MKNYALLIAGLGNPGPDYALTRHNFGFMAVDRLVERCGGEENCPAVNARGDCLTRECRPARNLPPVLTAKPQTYMNLSGLAVGRLASRFSIPAGDVLVIHDDLDLELGRMKLKQGGGDAGHNGVKSVAEHLGTPGFLRLRLGIGRPPQRGGGRDFVLDAFSPEDMDVAARVLDAAIKGILLLLRRGLPFAVQHINAFDARPGGENPKET
ncbi:aminoacyl-tRNA hydrolase [Desulfocurvus sp. DL9XJH121]